MDLTTPGQSHPDQARHEPLGRALVFTAKAVREAFEETLAATGGSLGTWVVLSALSDEGIVSQTVLASHAHVEDATITHHIDRLETLGLVRRQADPTDRRVRRIELTAAGARLYRRLLTAAKQLENTLTAGLSEKQQAELRHTLDHIRANLDAGQGSLSPTATEPRLTTPRPMPARKTKRGTQT